MNDLIIPDSRFEMPSLFYPNRKPVGKVKIDLGHPLADGLTLFLLFQDNRVTDLVSGRVGEKFGDAHWTPNGMFFDESGAYLTVPDVVLDSSYTITWQASPADNAGSFYQYLFSTEAYGVANSINIYIHEDDELTPRRFRAAGDGYEVENLLDLDGYYPSMAELPTSLTVNGRNAAIFVDGEEKAANAAFGSSPMADGTTKTLYVGNRVDLNADRYFGGSVKFLMIHDKRLKNEITAKLHSNPYQFLIPA